jgi:hypothetical protein
VLMDFDPLSSRAKRARLAGESIVVKVVFGHCWFQAESAERRGEARGRAERDRRRRDDRLRWRAVSA